MELMIMNLRAACGILKGLALPIYLGGAVTSILPFVSSVIGRYGEP